MANYSYCCSCYLFEWLFLICYYYLIKMKKVLFVFILLFVDFLLVGCACTFNSDFENNINDQDDITYYTLIWPDEWYDDELESWKLVLRWEFDDHVDIIFIDQLMRQEYLNPHKMVYDDLVIFSWKLSFVDWAAWTHYYMADSIDVLDYVGAVDLDGNSSFPDSNVIYSEYWSQDIIGDRTIFYSSWFGISLRLWEAFDWWFVHEEDWEMYSTLTFFVKDDTALKDETWIDWYSDVFVIYIVPIDNFKEFSEVLDFPEHAIIWKNNKYYFVESRSEAFDDEPYYTDNYIFAVK